MPCCTIVSSLSTSTSLVRAAAPVIDTCSTDPRIANVASPLRRIVWSSAPAFAVVVSSVVSLQPARVANATSAATGRTQRARLAIVVLLRSGPPVRNGATVPEFSSGPVGMRRG
jgi:hypothetical protein